MLPFAFTLNIFTGSFFVLAFLCLLLYIYTKTTSTIGNDPKFREFQRVYLVVYLLAMGADWLQGPYVYALYDYYGMSVHDIEVLFVAGFGSSMIFGTIVGSFADKYGRRNNCILYAALYGLSCVTKHFNNFYILLVGRFLGGMATSILYSAFESWLVYEHNKRGFDPDWLGTVFSHAVLGNSLVAVVSGLAAQTVADMFGYVSPFDVSLTLLIFMAVILIYTWTENYGDSTVAFSQSFKKASASIKNDRKIMCLGLIQSLFEGSMYIFVLEWTPALTPASTVKTQTGNDKDVDGDGHRGSIPHGYIFAGFMVAIMIGSSLFKVLSKYTRVESFMRVVLLVAAISLLPPVLYPGEQTIIFFAFIIFEVCVGIFWPSIGTMRSIYVPEEARATIMNFFRIPLNLIVVVILTQNLGMLTIFKCCVGFLSIACCCQQWLFSLYLQLPKHRNLPMTEDEAPALEQKQPLEEKEAPMQDTADEEVNA